MKWGSLPVGAVLPWLAIAAVWMLTTEYARIDHDALLYTFQAIAHRHPELYSGDIYLRFGSQDNFSFFSALYSPLTEWLGFEGAAAWTTFAAMMALLLAAWRLARRLVPARLALMGLAFLVTLPTGYGAYGIFRVIEPFVSPRMPAEALGVCALLAILSGRRVLAGVLLLASASMHPLMAAPAGLIALYLAMPAGKRWMLPAASALGLAILSILGSLPMIDPLRVDAAWGQYLNGHAAYLFAANWHLTDWMGLCPLTLTLLLGSRVLESGQARQLCVAALFAASLGFAIMLIGSDWLRIALIVQGQGYRWVWPATLLSLLLLPSVMSQLWRLGIHGRAASLALAAAWLAPRDSFGITITLAAALVSVVTLRDLVAPAYRRWVLVGAALMLFIAVAFSIADRVMVAASPFFETDAPRIVSYLRYLFIGGLIPAALLVGIIALSERPAWRPVQVVVGLGLLGICLLLLPVSQASWSLRAYDSHVRAAFATWRGLIPEGSEVVWIEKPEAAWLLLERPSYYSLQQSMSGVFIRDAFREISARETRLIPFMQADGVRSVLKFLGNPPVKAGAADRTLAGVCKAIDARFLVARSAFSEKFLAAAPPGVPSTYRAMKLYRCDPQST